MISVSFLKDMSSETSILYFKITFSILVFLYAILYKGNIYKDIKLLENFSLIFIFFNFILSFLPFAYQYWGHVYTFNGLYYFKTDAALAIVIFLSFILLSRSLNIKVKIILALISLYLVYLTNARIHILSIFLVIGLSVVNQSLFIDFKRKLLKYSLLGAFLFIGFMGVYNTFSEGGLKIDITGEDAYDSANLQGRDKIWEALIRGYNDGSSLEQLFGTTLLKDVNIVSLYSTDTHNSHNSFLFFLIAIGIVGLLLFFYLTYIFLKRIIFYSKSFSKKNKSENLYKIYIILNLSLAHTAIFLISSLTNSNILFQQQTWFFLFFTGYLFNSKFIHYVQASFSQMKLP
ncbi:hypothetical protein ACH3PA_13125 [Leeuwenhoekiella sp. A2]|uniref:hypothetical protein n=1 Tax=Leeuwenhoekiella sp. A2 TaxID=3141460 RepID=UPI003A8040A3